PFANLVVFALFRNDEFTIQPNPPRREPSETRRHVDLTEEDEIIRIPAFSIDADRPLKLEARIEFPNGDFGKVHMTYEGLNRHCFGCKRSQSLAYQALTGPVGNFRGNVPNNKRPRFPNGDVSQRSPTRAGFPGQSKGEKRHKESESYWTTKANSGRDAPPKSMDGRRLEGHERYPHHQGKTIWTTTRGRGRIRWNATNAREDASRIDQGSDITLISHKLPNKVGDHGLREMKVKAAAPPERLQTRNIKVLLPLRKQTRNKPYQEGYKCVTVRMDKDPHAILTRDNGTVVIREGGIRSSPPAPRSVSPPLRLRDESEEQPRPNDMVLTREEEAEVDKLADEFGDPGYDAEIIDAISQLSPANAVNKENGAMTGAEKEPQPTTMNQMKNKSAGSSKIPQASSGQSRAGGTGEEKKKSYLSSELKGAQASKKLN
ncbi:hypothetical protein HID58_075895, partial [Brassica napus]